ncbi:hypothetical protein RI367_004640 [Sorochytrium milnesiophthora]
MTQVKPPTTALAARYWRLPPELREHVLLFTTPAIVAAFGNRPVFGKLLSLLQGCDDDAVRDAVQACVKHGWSDGIVAMVDRGFMVAHYMGHADGVDSLVLPETTVHDIAQMASHSHYIQPTMAKLALTLARVRNDYTLLRWFQHQSWHFADALAVVVVTKDCSAQTVQAVCNVLDLTGPQTHAFFERAVDLGRRDLLEWMLHHWQPDVSLARILLVPAAAAGHLQLLRLLDAYQESTFSTRYNIGPDGRFLDPSQRSKYARLREEGELAESSDDEDLLDDNDEDDDDDEEYDDDDGRRYIEAPVELVAGLHYLHDVCPTAAEKGHMHILQWCLSHRSRYPALGAMDRAASVNRLDVAEWLHVNWPDCPHAPQLSHAAGCGSVETMRWILRHYADAQIPRLPQQFQRAFTEALSKHNLEVANWLYSSFPCLYVEEDIVHQLSSVHLRGSSSSSSSRSLADDQHEQRPDQPHQRALEVLEWISRTTKYRFRLHTVSAALQAHCYSLAEWCLQHVDPATLTSAVVADLLTDAIHVRSLEGVRCILQAESCRVLLTDPQLYDALVTAADQDNLPVLTLLLSHASSAVQAQFQQQYSAVSQYTTNPAAVLAVE